MNINNTHTHIASGGPPGGKTLFEKRVLHSQKLLIARPGVHMQLGTFAPFRSEPSEGLLGVQGAPPLGAPRAGAPGGRAAAL